MERKLALLATAGALVALAGRGGLGRRLQAVKAHVAQCMQSCSTCKG